MGRIFVVVVGWGAGEGKIEGPECFRSDKTPCGF